MMFRHLNDQTFLNLLDRLTIKTTYLKLTLLDFQENYIREIAGTASGNGTLNINAASATRRTISFNMLADEAENNLTNLDNLISLNKKFKVAIGIENPMPEYQKEYGKIVWFKLGTYVISKASLSWSTSSCTISISGKDKMCLLDGSVGGTLPTTIAFHEIEVQQPDGNIVYEYPPIRQIIEEAVHHYGGEALHNIIVNDLDDQIKKLVKYGGDKALWIQKDSQTAFGKNIIFSNDTQSSNYEKYAYGEDVGYTLTDFTYPGELILSAGETIVALLNKIVSVLGNYEFFYDLDGRFIFQEIPNYLNKSDSAIYEENNQQFIRTFNNDKYAYSLKDAKTIISINNNPNYDNIKNDFIVWGQRPIANSNNTTPICYRLAIDDKPDLNLSKLYMLKCIQNGMTVYKFTNNINIKENDDIVINSYPYYYIEKDQKVEAENQVFCWEIDIDANEEEVLNQYQIVAVPAPEWREELYRAALQAAAAGATNTIYDRELLAFWRQNFDPSPKAAIDETWQPSDNHIYDIQDFWSDNVKNHPEKVTYWLDFIDTTSKLGTYSVNNIGRRTKVTNSQEVKSLFNKEVPDILFLQNPGNIEEILNLKNQMLLDNQNYTFVKEKEYELFLASATGSSAYDLIREMLYQYLVYNTQATLTCIPKYYLDTNMLIYIQNEKSGVIGDYVIKTISLPLGYSGSMNITASQALTRI